MQTLFQKELVEKAVFHPSLNACLSDALSFLVLKSFACITQHAADCSRRHQTAVKLLTADFESQKKGQPAAMLVTLQFFLSCLVRPMSIKNQPSLITPCLQNGTYMQESTRLCGKNASRWQWEKR